MGDLTGIGHANVKDECTAWLKEFGPSLTNQKLPVAGCGVTSGGGLSAKYIIHSRGPIWDEIPDSDAKPKIFQNSIRMSTYTIFDTAMRLGAVTVAMPPCAKNSVEVTSKSQIVNVIEYCCVCDPGSLKSITLCISDPNTYQTYKTVFN